MALRIDPFAGDKPARTPQVGARRFSRLRIFDDPAPADRKDCETGASRETRNDRLESGGGDDIDRGTDTTIVGKDRVQSGANRVQGDTAVVGAPRMASKYASETKSKTSSNQVQTGCKTSSNQVQTGCKTSSNQVQTGCENRCEIGGKSGAVAAILRLSPSQRFLLHVIAESCRQTRSDVSPPVPIETLCGTTHLKPETVKSALKRLMRREILLRRAYKAGRGGWSQYSLPEMIYQEILDVGPGELGANWVHTGCKLGAKTGAKTGADTPCSSSSDLTTTTTPKIKLEKEIATRLESAAERFGLLAFGLGPNDLLQIWRKGVFDAEDELVASVEHVAFYLASPAAASLNSPKAWAMATLAKGYYAPPPGFQSWEERQILQRLAAKTARLQRLRELRHREFDADFQIWLEEKTAEELRQALAGTPFADTPRSLAGQALLRQRFAEEVGISDPRLEEPDSP